MKLHIETSALDYQKLVCLASDDATDLFRIDARRYNRNELGIIMHDDLKTIAAQMFQGYRFHDRNETLDRFVQNLDLARRVYIENFMKYFRNEFDKNFSEIES
jgi:hypothetical protein